MYISASVVVPAYRVNINVIVMTMASLRTKAILEHHILFFDPSYDLHYSHIAETGRRQPLSYTGDTKIQGHNVRAEAESRIHFVSRNSLRRAVFSGLARPPTEYGHIGNAWLCFVFQVIRIDNTTPYHILHPVSNKLSLSCTVLIVLQDAHNPSLGLVGQ